MAAILFRERWVNKVRPAQWGPLDVSSQNLIFEWYMYSYDPSLITSIVSSRLYLLLLSSISAFSSFYLHSIYTANT